MKLEKMSGVGPATLSRLQKLGLHSVEDLLLHLPLRYEDRTRVVPIAQLTPGAPARFFMQVDQARQVPGRRPSLLIEGGDESGRLSIRLFHFRPAQARQYAPGTRWLCWGEARPGRFGMEAVHPQMEPFAADEPPQRVGDVLTPIYPSTAGLAQQRWAALMKTALTLMPRLLPELVPGAPTLSLQQALALVHAPRVDDESALQAARERLALEELLAQRLAVLQSRLRLDSEQTVACPPALAVAAALGQQFAFQATAAQQRVIAEVGADLAQTQPMLRLVQGDVGCGKTAIAAHAAAQICAAGRQVALMAPTEILARQHAQTLEQWFAALGFRVALLVGGLPAAERRRVLAAAAAGDVDCVIGTHALFSEGVGFASLSLIIVDEQHRFGVGQRLALRDKSGAADVRPHQLIMTATPIPRTLAQTLYADLSVSQIDELPPGRSPVQTVALAQSRRDEVVERLRVVCAQGQRAFWVCPALSESEHATAAQDVAEHLGKALPELQIGLLHGQLKSSQKLDVMAAFRSGEMQILVATTVVEVGVDVPQASIMIIDEAERLGLAQLHQLRGRVGRGGAQSYCLLMYKPPLGETARARLDALRQIDDGFSLAEKDLELRGAGELLGTAQSGEQRLRFADYLLDTRLLPQVVSLAEQMIAESPSHVAPLVRRWLGASADYAQV